ncbi:hypothetical protein ACFVAJ_10330 [Agromyces sp. NPDC057679]|uniref:hypothetical protein n=1 Tax=Agromyces sp. NPDC057679 TaxID=3346207 RepID=UPI0036724157
MRFSDEERANIDFLVGSGLDYSVIELTQTGLTKATLDATANVRDFLLRASIHDYRAQSQGPDHKRTLSATLVHPDGRRTRSRVTLFRPQSGNGDPRIWLSGLRELCSAGEKCVLLEDEGGLLVLNLTSDDFRSNGNRINAKSMTHGERVDDYWGAYERLWERATGGKDVAARPESQSSEWPSVARAPGVDAAWQWLAAGVKGDAPPRMVFLVGGPGAGKSHAAAAIVAELHVQHRAEARLAERSYDYELGPARLTVVNDATIRSDSHESLALSGDIDTAVERGSNLLACVNRGVLVEEVSQGRGSTQIAGAGQIVVDWLHRDGAQGEVSSFASGDWEIQSSAGEAYIQCGRLLRSSEPVADMVMVFVDVCSLFESTPTVVIQDRPADHVTVQADPYNIGDFGNPVARLDSSAGELLGSMLDALGANGLVREDPQFLNPFLANKLSLSNASVRAGALNVLRAAEIVSGQRFTFREVWGAAARLVVADAPERVPSHEAQNYLASLQPRSRQPLDRFGEVRELAEIRFSQALFGAAGIWKGGARDAIRNPVTRLTSLADPVRDPDPGEFTPHEPKSGWATPVAEAFSGLAASGSPLEILLSAVSSDDAVRDAITAFDWSVDSAFVDAIRSDSISDPERFECIGWYGAYLTRLYAVANGIPAFRREISAWTETWHLSPAVPSHVASHLRTLLRPKKSGGLDATSLIPVFESRTYPIVGDVETPRLALRSGDFEIETARSGERLVLSILERGNVVSSIALDFPLVREAMSCIGNTVGITDVSDDVSPRLERFRSKRLVPSQVQSGQDYVVLSGARLATLQVG